MPPCLVAKEDRYGGVEISVTPPEGGAAPDTHAAAFAAELASQLARWQAAGKCGLWLTIPTAAAACVGPAAQAGFDFHHAKPGYVLLTRWLPDTPSPLPRYGFTQIGVGGVVLNTAGEVLMVVEKVSPMAQLQGSWKLPGGLADPGEDFAETVAREVREEVGVTAELEGVVSLRHAHGFRFGQGDLYVIVRLRTAPGAEAITIDPNELADARWMSRAEIESRVADPKDGQPLDGKVAVNNWRYIENALSNALIVGSTMASSVPGKKANTLYTAPRPAPP